MSSYSPPRVVAMRKQDGLDLTSHGARQSPWRSDMKSLVEAMLISAVLMGVAFLLNADQGLSWADEGLLWYGSQRVHAGEIPVRDFFSYDPGRYYWTATFYTLLSSTSLRTTLLAGSVFASLALTLTLFTLANAGVSRKWRWLLAIAICIAFTYPRHKIYEQSLSLVLACAIYFVLANVQSTKQWAILGLVTGLAAIMGRNHGVFFVAGSILTVGLVLLTTRPLLRPMHLGSYSMGVVLGYAPMWLLCLFNESFFQAFKNSVLQTAGWQIPIQIPFIWNIDFSSLQPSMKWHAAAVGLMCLMIPLVYLGSIGWVGYKQYFSRATRSNLLLAGCSIAGLPYLHQSFDRADFGHIAQGFLPSLGALTCIAFAASSGLRKSRGVQWFSMMLLSITVASWLPYIPLVRISLLEARNMGATTQFTMDGTPYRIESYQASLLNKVRHIQETCDLSDGQFLAAPHFPGLYAFMHLAAPHWDSYYVYNRSSSMQHQHLLAMSNVKLALIAPEATIDGLSRLKFNNTYRDSLNFLESNLNRSLVEGFPTPLYLYVKPGTCAG